MPWTTDRVDTLKKLWNGGESASLIARTLGEVTRNAVIGKAHRLGLAGRATRSRLRSAAHLPALCPARARGSKTRKPPQPRQRPRRDWQPRANAVPKRPPLLPELGPPPEERVTVQSLTGVICRWPIGDPKRDGFHFCGRAKGRAPGPYCDHHAAIAFR